MDGRIKKDHHEIPAGPQGFGQPGRLRREEAVRQGVQQAVAGIGDPAAPGNSGQDGRLQCGQGQAGVKAPLDQELLQATGRRHSERVVVAGLFERAAQIEENARAVLDQLIEKGFIIPEGAPAAA